MDDKGSTMMLVTYVAAMVGERHEVKLSSKEIKSIDFSIVQLCWLKTSVSQSIIIKLNRKFL